MRGVFSFFAVAILAAESAWPAVFPVSQGGKIGFIDASGKLVVPPQFDFSRASGEYWAVRSGSKWGFLDSNGQIRFPAVMELGLPPQMCGEHAWMFRANELLIFDRNGGSRVIAKGDRSYGCSNGLITLRREGKWSFLRPDGTPAFEAQFDEAFPFSNGYAAVRIGSKWGYIDAGGKVVVQPAFTAAGEHSEGLFPVKQGDLWGFVDLQGKWVAPAKFAEAERFVDGRAVIAAFTKDGLTRFGMIDRQGKEVVPPRYTLIRPMSCGRAVAMDQGKFGFLDADGKAVIPLQFSDAQDFRDGVALVKIKDHSGKVTAMYVDVKGATVWRGEDIP